MTRLMNRFSLPLILVLAVLLPQRVQATHFLGIQVVDKDYLMLHFRDGEVRYRDDATGPSAYLGHSFAEGDDTMKVFLPRLDTRLAASAEDWSVSSSDDRSFRGGRSPLAAYRKSKPMNTDHTLASELDHWIFLRLPAPMKQGCTYTVGIPAGLGSDVAAASIRYDIWSAQSEAVHVNILGYTPAESVKTADLYLWLGDGGERDYSAFEGKRVYLYNVATGDSRAVGEVKRWKEASEIAREAGGKDLTGSTVWNVDFRESAPGRYRLVVEDVGCSMDFDIDPEIYWEPYRFSVRGYYYMRLGEPVDPRISPVPRQPRFVPGEDPEGFVVYKTDLQPWHPDWRQLRGDVWDEPHFKAKEASAFWQHRLPGNPVNPDVRGGHSDAFDWDRHLAHVSNIYDLLLPYLLTGGRLSEDNTGIRESGNGIPDLIDEARNEVDFFLSIRDGEAYSQGVTNPDKDWTVMFQAGCTTMAAWANAANCAMLADAFRVQGNAALREEYTAEAEKAFRFAERQEDLQLDVTQGIGNEQMRGRDFRQMAAAFLYNVTGERAWEDILAEESAVTAPDAPVIKTGFRGAWYQLWGTAAYLMCPHERHYPALYRNMVAAVRAQARADHLDRWSERPSRRSSSDARWQTNENLQLVMLLHSCSDSAEERSTLEQAMYQEAGWGLGRNPSNTVEMTGLGQRHITDCYSTGRNDGEPGTHPGQTPFNGTETWSRGDGGDAQILLTRCYPDWNAGWPRQESFFNQRYLWVNGEFTPRETMRGKTALLAYLYGIRN
jgi:endoglucanase